MHVQPELARGWDTPHARDCKRSKQASIEIMETQYFACTMNHYSGREPRSRLSKSFGSASTKIFTLIVSVERHRRSARTYALRPSNPNHTIPWLTWMLGRFQSFDQRGIRTNHTYVPWIRYGKSSLKPRKGEKVEDWPDRSRACFVMISLPFNWHLKRRIWRGWILMEA